MLTSANSGKIYTSGMLNIRKKKGQGKTGKKTQLSIGNFWSPVTSLRYIISYLSMCFFVRQYPGKDRNKILAANNQEYAHFLVLNARLAHNGGRQQIGSRKMKDALVLLRRTDLMFFRFALGKIFYFVDMSHVRNMLISFQCH